MTMHDQRAEGAALEECPFCGHTQVDVYDYGDHARGFRVNCGCGARGPARDNAAAAEAAWNDRRAPRRKEVAAKGEAWVQRAAEAAVRYVDSLDDATLSPEGARTVQHLAAIIAKHAPASPSAAAGGEDYDALARAALIHVSNMRPHGGSREEEDRDVSDLAAILKRAAGATP